MDRQWLLIGGILGTFLHYLRYGPKRDREDKMKPSSPIARFSVTERMPIGSWRWHFCTRR